METRNDIRPFAPQHPGTILREELKQRGIKQKDFAERIGMQPSHLSALLHGTRNISPQLAARLEAVLQIPARLWLNLQNNYNMDQLRVVPMVSNYSFKDTSVGMLCEPTPEEKTLWDHAFHAGQNNILDKLDAELSLLGIDGKRREELIEKLRAGNRKKC